MGILKSAEVTPESIGPGRTRYLTHTDQLMMVVIDFNDGPTNEPDPPHSHPHEQVSYVVAGEVIFFLGNEQFHLVPGDIFTVPPDIPHSVQLLTELAETPESALAYAAVAIALAMVQYAVLPRAIIPSWSRCVTIPAPSRGRPTTCG